MCLSTSATRSATEASGSGIASGSDSISFSISPTRSSARHAKVSKSPQSTQTHCRRQLKTSLRLPCALSVANQLCLASKGAQRGTKVFRVGAPPTRASCRSERPDPLGPLGTTPRPPEGTTTRPPKGTTGRGCGGSTGTPPEGTTGRGCGGNTGRPQGGSTQINDFQAPIQWPRHVCRGVVAWGKERKPRK